MRIDKSPFKSPYPPWVHGVFAYLSISLAGAVVIVCGEQYEDSTIAVLSFVLYFGLIFHGLLSYFGIPLHFFLCRWRSLGGVPRQSCFRMGMCSIFDTTSDSLLPYICLGNLLCFSGTKKNEITCRA